ncbi:MAG: leucine-rich repeat protein [Oscillospiraceae bacterium]|nr:leucine-rich repeat protein [Oscillospiraceae bacterium]
MKKLVALALVAVMLATNTAFSANPVPVIVVGHTGGVVTWDDVEKALEAYDDGLWRDDFPFTATFISGVKAIGDAAFEDCALLEGVTLPNGVTSIGKEAFSNCASLKSITIPGSVTSLGEGAFEGCGLVSVTIPGSVVSIGDGAFADCELKSVTILSGVKTIGEGAFSGCSSLKSITIPGSVASIREQAFMWCYALESVTILNGVKRIESGAFEFCTALKGITIPKSVTFIASDAFDDSKFLVIYCYFNSVAHKYAKEDYISFKLLDSIPKFAVAVKSANKKHGKVSKGKRIAYGKKIRVKAAAKKGYKFSGWYVGKRKVSGKSSYSYRVTKKVTLTARFKKKKKKPKSSRAVFM